MKDKVKAVVRSFESSLREAVEALESNLTQLDSSTPGFRARVGDRVWNRDMEKEGEVTEHSWSVESGDRYVVRYPGGKSKESDGHDLVPDFVPGDRVRHVQTKTEGWIIRRIRGEDYRKYSVQYGKVGGSWSKREDTWIWDLELLPPQKTTLFREGDRIRHKYTGLEAQVVSPMDEDGGGCKVVYDGTRKEVRLTDSDLRDHELIPKEQVREQDREERERRQKMLESLDSGTRVQTDRGPGVIARIERRKLDYQGKKVNVIQEIVMHFQGEDHLISFVGTYLNELLRTLEPTDPPSDSRYYVRIPNYRHWTREDPNPSVVIQRCDSKGEALAWIRENIGPCDGEGRVSLLQEVPKS